MDKIKRMTAGAFLVVTVAGAQAAESQLPQMPKAASSCEVVPFGGGYGVSIRNKANREIAHSGVLRHDGAPSSNKRYIGFSGSQRDQKSNVAMGEDTFILIVRKADGMGICALNNFKIPNNPEDSFKNHWGVAMKTAAGPVPVGITPREVLGRLSKVSTKPVGGVPALNLQ